MGHSEENEARYVAETDIKAEMSRAEGEDPSFLPGELDGAIKAICGASDRAPLEDVATDQFKGFPSGDHMMGKLFDRCATSGHAAFY